MRHGRLAVAIVMLAVVATAALSFAYEDWGFRSGPPPVRIAVDVWVGFAPLYLAQDKGFFAARGVEVDLVTMKGAEEIRAGLAAGDLDGQTTSLDTILMQNDQGVPSTAVMALDRSHGGDGIVGVAEARSMAGLRGRTIAFQPATPSHFFLMYQLDRVGMTLEDVKGRHMDSGDAGAAFVAGKIEAAVTWEPWLTRAASTPGSLLLASTRSEETVIVDVLAFRPPFLRDRGEDVRAIAAAWDDAVQYWRSHPEEANAAMATHFSLAPAEFADMIQGLRYLDLEENRQLMGTSTTPGPILDLVAVINRVFLKNGVTRSAHALAEVLAFDFL